jgi:hypothetical protein
MLFQGEREQERKTMNNVEKNWWDHSDTIFTVISTSADNYEMAKQMVMLYVLDPAFSRAGISHALKRLEEYYKKENNNNVHQSENSN